MKVNQVLKNFFMVRFTTAEMEQSRTRCGVDFEIIEISYDDNTRFPRWAIGFVVVDGYFDYKVTWNEYGECNVHGHRIRSFDLIRPRENILDSERVALVGTIGIVIILIVMMIWN